MLVQTGWTLKLPRFLSQPMPKVGSQMPVGKLQTHHFQEPDWLSVCWLASRDIKTAVLGGMRQSWFESISSSQTVPAAVFRPRAGAIGESIAATLSCTVSWFELPAGDQNEIAWQASSSRQQSTFQWKLLLHPPL